MNSFRELMFYGGIDKDTFKQIRDDITKSNCESLSVFALISLVGMFFMVAFSYFDASLAKNRLAYIGCFLFSVCLYVFANTVEKHSKKVYIGVYAFVVLLYAFGIALGTYIEPNEVSVSFPVLLFAVPLLFTDRPVRMTFFSVLGIVAYIITAGITQDSIMFGYNLTNVVPYGVISIMTSTYLMRIKIDRYVLEHRNRHLIESDQLTGMLNRRSFDQNIRIIREGTGTKGITVCAFDVNGLKMVNDTFGHHAGDELIRGAASSIEGVFGQYGECYRVGGDEFMAVITGEAPAADELMKNLVDRCSCFKGMLVSGLSISVGIVKGDGTETIDELIKKADALMYEDKQRYYQSIDVKAKG